jgi:DNA-directed RNA polymerase subunit RPC12/RpoP
MNKQSYWQRLTDDELDTSVYEKIKSSTRDKRDHDPEQPFRKHDPKEKEFRCVACGRFIPTQRESSGVNNRNHCPHCLTSRHVDLNTPGDRKAECHSKMVPIGLTIKRTMKKYGELRQGELMLIHQCAGCGKYSINRIAGDDDPLALYRVFTESENLSLEVLSELAGQGIDILSRGDMTVVFSQLFGWEAIVEELSQYETVHEEIRVNSQ